MKEIILMKQKPVLLILFKFQNFSIVFEIFLYENNYNKISKLYAYFKKK